MSEALVDSAQSSIVFVTSPPQTDPYTTTFPATENPISQGGIWVNGAANGTNWHNVQTTPGKAFASAFVGDTGNAHFSDDIAILKTSVAPFGPNQYAEAVVYRAAGYAPSGKHEIELLLRFSIAANDAHGYEVTIGIQGATAYLSVIRWNGAIGSFNSLMPGGADFVIPVPADGDVMRAEIIGNLIKVYKNGTQIGPTIDITSIGGTVWSSGQLGIGFWPTTGTTLASYGWKSLEAGTIAGGGGGTSMAYISSLSPYSVRTLSGTYAPTNGFVTLRSVIPSAFQSDWHVINPWSGGGKSMSGTKMYVHGGGHGDSYNNGVYMFDFAGSTVPTGWSLVRAPVGTPLPTYTSPGGVAPTAAHTYDGLVHASDGYLYRFLGSGSPLGGTDSTSWKCNLTTGVWTQLTNAPAAFGSNAGMTIYDPITGKIMLANVAIANVYFYCIATNTFSPAKSTAAFSSGTSSGTSGFDNTRNRVPDFKTGQLWNVNFGTANVVGGETISQQNFTLSTSFFASETGCFYDQSRDVYWLFGGRTSTDWNNIYEIPAGQTPGTQWTVITHQLLENGVQAVIPVLAGNHRGTYGRFVFMPAYRAIGFCEEVNSPAFVVKLP